MQTRNSIYKKKTTVHIITTYCFICLHILHTSTALNTLFCEPKRFMIKYIQKKNFSYNYTYKELGANQ